MYLPLLSGKIRSITRYGNSSIRQSSGLTRRYAAMPSMGSWYLMRGRRKSGSSNRLKPSTDSYAQFHSLILCLLRTDSESSLIRTWLLRRRNAWLTSEHRLPLSVTWLSSSFSKNCMAIRRGATRLRVSASGLQLYSRLTWRLSVERIMPLSCSS